MEEIVTWAAPIATTTAALMTAANLGSRITGWGFVVFTVGSIGWITPGLTTDQPNMVWQNAVLTLLNLFGIWRWLGRQAKLAQGEQLAYVVISSGGVGGAGEIVPRLSGKDARGDGHCLAIALHRHEFERLQQRAKDDWR